MKTNLCKLLYPVLWIYDLAILFINRKEKTIIDVVFEIKELGVRPKANDK